MKLMNMKSTAKSEGMGLPSSVAADPPTYPYGLTISLDNESLAKLGIENDLPEVGDKLIIMAHATVQSVSSSESEGDKSPRQSVTLQITDMACAPATMRASDADVLYGKKGA